MKPTIFIEVMVTHYSLQLSKQNLVLNVLKPFLHILHSVTIYQAG